MSYLFIFIFCFFFNQMVYWVFVMNLREERAEVNFIQFSNKIVNEPDFYSPGNPPILKEKRRERSSNAHNTSAWIVGEQISGAINNHES